MSKYLVERFSAAYPTFTKREASKIVFKSLQTIERRKANSPKYQRLVVLITNVYDIIVQFRYFDDVEMENAITDVCNELWVKAENMVGSIEDVWHDNARALISKKKYASRKNS